MARDGRPVTCRDFGALEDCPKSPWRSRNQLTDPADLLRLEAQSSSALDDIGLRPLYELYRVLAPRMNPAEANELELWEIAAFLGLDAGDDLIGGLDERLANRGDPGADGVPYRQGTCETAQVERRPCQHGYS